MRTDRRIAFLLFAFAVTPCTGRAQSPVDSATLQIRRTTFAPWLHVNLFYSYQTWSGTFVRDLLAGRGLPQGVSSKVRVQFRMWLADGTPVFYPKDTVMFVVGRGAMIRGIEEGVTGMRAGGVRQLVIPSTAAFGPSGRDAIPPNAVIVAEVALVGFAVDSTRLAR